MILQSSTKSDCVEYECRISSHIHHSAGDVFSKPGTQITTRRRQPQKHNTIPKRCNQREHKLKSELQWEQKTLHNTRDTACDPLIQHSQQSSWVWASYLKAYLRDLTFFQVRPKYLSRPQIRTPTWPLLQIILLKVFCSGCIQHEANTKSITETQHHTIQPAYIPAFQHL